MGNLYGTFRDEEEKLRDMVNEISTKFRVSIERLEKSLSPAAKNLARQFLKLDEDVLEKLRISCKLLYPGLVKISVHIGAILLEGEEDYELKLRKRAAALLKISEDYIEISVISIGGF